MSPFLAELLFYLQTGKIRRFPDGRRSCSECLFVENKRQWSGLDSDNDRLGFRRIYRCCGSRPL